MHPISRTSRLLLAFLLALPAALMAQGKPLGQDADFLKEPDGTVLGRLARGVAVTTASTRGNWQEFTLDGWIETRMLRDDRREGFDVAVNQAAGAPLRAGPGSGASLGTAKAGALFKKLEARNGWTHIRRQVWSVRAAFNAPASPPPAPVAPPPAAARPPASQATATILAAPP